MSARLNAVLCVGTVVQRGDEILLVRQASGHPLEGQWSIPWGYVDEGESPRDAALRETVEESNVTVAVEGLIGVQDLPEYGAIGLVFLCRYESGDPEPDGQEVDLADFFTLDGLEGVDRRIETWCKWVVRRVLMGKHQMIPLELSNPYAPRDGFF